MSAGLRLLLDALATFRLVRLVTSDTITAEARDAVIRRAYVRAGRSTAKPFDGRPGGWADDVVPNDPDPPKLATLVTCPWCAGFWVALVVVAARRRAPRSWALVAEALALSAAAGLASENLQRS